MSDHACLVLAAGLFAGLYLLGICIEAGMKAIAAALKDQRWNVNLPTINVKTERQP